MLRSLRFRIALASALALDLGAGPMILSAQQTPADVPTITIRANTRLVVVDVVVTDKKGQPVTGLKAEDFVVEENGKKQKVSSFVPPGAVNASNAQTAPPPGILSNHPEHIQPNGVPTILLLDAANSPFRDQAYARLQMLKYVVEQGQGGNPMAVLTLTDQLHVLQQFTSDPQVLMTAIRNLRPQEQLLSVDASVPESHAASTNDLTHGGGANVNAIASATAAAQQFEDVTVAFNLERRTLLTIDAMKSLSRILGGLPGRKNVVWLTSSIPFDLVPEDRNVSNAELATALPQMGNQAISLREAGAAAAQQRQLYAPEIKQAESQLASADIAIYPVNLQGLVSGMENSAAHAGSAYSDTALSDRALAQASNVQAIVGTMEQVAAHTGGKAYVNQNEIKNGIALAVSDEKATYVLGYYPENKKWDGDFRNIKVKLSRSDTQIRYRKGYYAIEPGPTKGHNFEQDVASALEVGAPATQVSFMAQAKPTDPGKVRVIFLVDARTLSAEDSGGSKKMNVTLYAGLYDGSGKSLGIRSTKVDRAFDAATYQQILDHGMMVPIDMDVAASAKELRLAVLDGKTGFIGTASGPLSQ